MARNKSVILTGNKPMKDVDKIKDRLKAAREELKALRTDRAELRKELNALVKEQKQVLRPVEKNFKAVSKAFDKKETQIATLKTKLEEQAS